MQSRNSTDCVATQNPKKVLYSKLEPKEFNASQRVNRKYCYKGIDTIKK